MEAASAPAEVSSGGGGKKTLRYGATYKAYTESGAGHFKTYIDALRELIDNSVEYALRGNTEEGESPEIQVVISLKGHQEEHVVAVGDNGRGMKEKHLKDFPQWVSHLTDIVLCTSTW